MMKEREIASPEKQSGKVRSTVRLAKRWMGFRP